MNLEGLIMKTAHVFLALTLATAAVSVNAATVTDWGVHDEVEFGFGSGSGAFTDIFSFTLPGMGDLSTSAVSTVLKPKVGPFYGQVQLFEGVYGGMATLLGGFTFGPNTAYNYYTVPGLSAGSYYYAVSGTYNGRGSYALDSAYVPAVPEPETWALLGIGMVAVAAARRSRRA